MKLRSSYETVYCKSNNSVTTQLHGFNLQIKYCGQLDIFCNHRSFMNFEFRFVRVQCSRETVLFRVFAVCDLQFTRS